MRKSGKQRTCKDAFLRFGAQESADGTGEVGRLNRTDCSCASTIAVAEAPTALWINDHSLFYFAERTRETGRQYKNEYLYAYAFEENSWSRQYLKECIATSGRALLGSDGDAGRANQPAKANCSLGELL